jgi:signal transduction histidine kinase
VEQGQQREASYTRIVPGAYTFRLKSCNDWGLWSDPEIRLSIKVDPHYWQTWTFRIVATLVMCGLVAGVVAGVVRARHRRRIMQLEQQRAMDGERARIAQDLHDDLGSGLTEISFGSEFAQDTSLDIEQARLQTKAIGNRARELVAALDEIVWAVNPKNDTVASLASYQIQYAERFLKTTRLRLRLNVARDLPASPLNADERHNLFLAFKEALHNVVQHSKAADVHLTIDVECEVLRVVVADNGCGFNPKIVISEADGLGNMRRRLEQIGGSYHSESLVGKGTTATFTFPLSRATGRPRQ